jgi:large subunit ribosomal protein L13
MSASTLSSEIYIDGEKLVLGRLASVVAKRLLSGDKVIVVNVEKTVLMGSWGNIVREWEHRYELKSVINPFRHSPKRYVRPDRYFRSVVRKMLPYNKPRGKDALSRLRVYVGVPAGLSGAHFQKPDTAAVRSEKGYHELGKVSKRFGWNGE